MLELVLDGDSRGLIQNVLAFFVCGAALIWGAAPERIVAVTWLVFFEAAGWLYERATGSGVQLLGVDTFAAATDVVAGIVLVVVALYANRNYPLFIAGMQVLAMTAHLARGMSEIIAPIAYATMVLVPGWFQLLFLAIGVGRHIRRTRIYGDYRSWRLWRGQAPSNISVAGPGAARQQLFSGNASWRDELK
ncbi:hypothetical protein CD351_15225 [Erythrobacter sp. KY5]|uniref:hypothetical protein n=1 Tax=Erythrobacter sp. KY5 TaxID=2011159 RepID=UPI000DBF2E37|nr:hypothetical protein [Erythrobacter sp. KY5]AWW75781.1 hypothetical protein CD351_15225 [Erythrobacter sp. KY5]